MPAQPRSGSKLLSKQAAAVATALRKARGNKLDDPVKYARRRRRAERSDDDDDDDTRENLSDKERATPLGSEDGRDDDDDDDDAGGENGGAVGEDPATDNTESDDGATTKEQLAKVKKLNRDLMKRFDDLQTLLEQHGVKNTSTGDQSASKSATKKYHPIPANRSALTVDELQEYLGIEGNHERWLAIRNHARGIVSKGNFNWDLPWGQQSFGVKNLAGNALHEAVPEFVPFVSNWGANHLIQDTFNHRRNRPVSATPKDNSSPAVVKIDKRKRAYKAAQRLDTPAVPNGGSTGANTGPGVGGSTTDASAGPAARTAGPALNANNPEGQGADTPIGNNLGSSAASTAVTSHPSIDSTLKESSQAEQQSPSRPPSSSRAKASSAPRPRPVTRSSSSSTLDQNPVEGALSRGRKATAGNKPRGRGTGSSKRGVKEVDQPNEPRTKKHRRITR